MKSSIQNRKQTWEIESLFRLHILKQSVSERSLSFTTYLHDDRRDSWTQILKMMIDMTTGYKFLT